MHVKLAAYIQTSKLQEFGENEAKQTRAENAAKSYF